MTPAARVAAAIDVLNKILEDMPAEAALIAWARRSRYAGSGDRAAVRDLVYEALRRRTSLAIQGGELSGRGLMIGLTHANGQDPDTIFTGIGHAPPILEASERSRVADESAVISDLPEWIWQIWQESLGKNALDIAHSMRDRAAVWLRVNPRRAEAFKAVEALAQEGIIARPHGILPGALQVIAGERRISGSAAYLKGMVEIQDLSPQLACALLPLSKGVRVLDYCAGGGGKALALGAREDMFLTAHDIAPKRMSDLPARARRAGINVLLSPPENLGRDYDLVLADVPCSGSGTWRRTPDSKWRLTRSDLHKLVNTQREIMSKAAVLVRDGGRLAYMTCSLLNNENDAQIDHFIGLHPEFHEEHRQRWTPQDASDGFFLSILQRNRIG